jgi:hypothetical protein
MAGILGRYGYAREQAYFKTEQASCRLTPPPNELPWRIFSRPQSCFFPLSRIGWNLCVAVVTGIDIDSLE